MASCRACKSELRAHVQELRAHRRTAKHKKNMALFTALPLQQNQLETYVTSLPRPPSYTREIKIAQLRLAVHIDVHGSLASADHLTPLISDTFRDSFVASSLSMGRNKCTAIVIKVLGQTFKELLLDNVRGGKFSLVLDERTDVSSTKELAVFARHYSR